MEALSERQKKILAAVIEAYVESAEPVGSKFLAKRLMLGVSAATIRNELAELTALGYLEQPHTSAGRIPTVMGYRLYVDELMQRQKLSLAETEKISHSLRMKARQLDQLLDEIGKLTDYPTLAVTAQSVDTVQRFDLIYVDANTFIIVVLLSSNTVKNKLVHLPFSVERSMMQKLGTVFNADFCGIPEERMDGALIAAAERATGDTMGLVAAIAGFAIDILTERRNTRAVVSGEERLLRQPEFRDPDKAHNLLAYLSDETGLSQLPTSNVGEDVQVLIGSENAAEALKDSSVILARFDAGDGMQGVIGVIGPTRMDYAHIAAKLSYIAEGLSQALKDGSGSVLPGFEKLMLKEKN